MLVITNTFKNYKTSSWEGRKAARLMNLFNAGQTILETVKLI